MRLNQLIGVALAVCVLGLAACSQDPEPEATAQSGSASQPEMVAVPQTLMMTTEQASETLESSGLTVAVRAASINHCDLPDGRVLGSRPAPTARVDAGSTVTLQVFDRDAKSRALALASCVGGTHPEDALALLDLARFSEGGPTFAPTVQVWVNGKLTTSLTTDDAADPAAWGDRSPLTVLTDAVDDVVRFNGQLRSPTIWTRLDHGHQYACGSADPPDALATRPSTVVTVDHPPVGIAFVCHWVRLYRDPSGRVDVVTSSVVRRPGDGSEDQPGRDIPADPTAAQRAVAASFAAFADGGPSPAFAPQVELYLGDQLVDTMTASEAADRSSWILACGGYAERSCPIDALSTVAHEKHRAVTGSVVRESSACYTLQGRLPSWLTSPEALAASVSLSVPEPASCIDNWELQLWYDDQGAFQAANLLLGAP